MMRSDVLNMDNYPVRAEMTGLKHIPILHVCSTDDNVSKEFLVDKNLLHVCFTDKGKSKALSSMKVLRRIANQNASKKVYIKKKMQIMKQNMRNPWLWIIQLSIRRDILKYSNVVRIS